jgi:hypothetical protein
LTVGDGASAATISGVTGNGNNRFVFAAGSIAGLSFLADDEVDDIMQGAITDVTKTAAPEFIWTVSPTSSTTIDWSQFNNGRLSVGGGAWVDIIDVNLAASTITTSALLGSDPKVTCAAEALGATWAQAAILQSPREQVLRQLAGQNRFGLVEACSRKGDRAADLILFSKAILEKNRVAQYWKALDDAPDEIKCLRNYLLFLPLEHVRDLLTDNEAQMMIESLSPKAPLGSELIERIKKRQRSVFFN